MPKQWQNLDKPVKDPAHEQSYVPYELDKSSRDEDGKTYLEERGIERATYQEIRGMKTNLRGAIFGLYTKIGVQQGQGELCALEHYPKDSREINKELQAYLPRGLSVIRPNGEVKEILITGSPISALSHKQLYLTAHTLYVSTCGHLTKDTTSNLEEILLQAKNNR